MIFTLTNLLLNLYFILKIVTQSELNIKLKNIIVFGSVVLAATSKNRGMYIKVGIGIFDYGVL